MEKVTAIILNYNSSTDTKKCIEFLIRQSYNNLDILIIDNNSSKESEVQNLQEIVKNKNIKLILHNENKGFSAGNNIGLKYAIENGADWCLIINPDIELRDTNYIEYIISQSKKWNEAVVIGTNIVLPSGKRQNPQREAGFLEEVLWPVQSLKSKIIKNFNWYLMEDKTGYCDKVCGGCFFIKSSFVKDINYFDENVFMYSEEAILSKLVKKYNKKELYISEKTANHEHYDIKKASSKSRMLLFLKSRLYYIENYSGYRKIKKFALKFSLGVEKIYIKWKK